MNKILWTVYIINFLFFISLFAQEKNDKKLKTTDVKENFMAAEMGFNFSDFNNSTDSQGKFGFLLGLTRNIPLNKYFGINFSLFFSSQRILAKNLETTGTNGQIVYRLLYDYNVNILFLELPVQINYKLIEKESFKLYAALGSGLSIQFKDYSEGTNFVNTGEIIDIDPPVDENPYVDDYPFQYSGININAGIWLTYNRFLFKLLYINKMYEIKKISKTYSIALTFGYAF